MYLKKIHIQGFKSFADKTEIEFTNDITAIVGPNGSGKSNVTDAIRWVLGEQSIKNLRGNKMEDVIFAGTNKRRALSFCEVTIFFDNTDSSIPLEYNEVAITRRMFRSGESEYYINKNECRLKDIRLLFMDTGIGKDGYSIIGQGRIDEILSNRPEDRRGIFEEAAGIIKYRTKKEEAEKRLKNVEENLIRINDLIYEISKQHKKLEKDSKKADKFINIFNKLKTLQTNIYIRDIEKIDREKTLLKNEKDQIDLEIKENKNQKDVGQNAFDLLKDEIKEKEYEIEDLRQKKDDIIKLKTKYKNRLSLLLERESFYEKDLKKIDKEIIDLDHQNRNLDNEILSIKGKESFLSEDLQELFSKYSIETEKLDSIDKKIFDLESYIDTGKENMNFLYQKIADKKSELSKINSIYSESDKRILELEREKKNIDKKIKKLIEKIKENKNSRNLIEKKLEELTQNQQIHIIERKNLGDSLYSNSAKINELDLDHERISANYKLYKNMEDSYEGYYKGVKNLLKAIENKKLDNNGFHGTVADLIAVDQTYETSINISLGGNIQNIVVDDEYNAKCMIEFLKMNKLGRVTFLPIKTIKYNILNLNFKQLKNEGVIGLAYQLIKYDERYENILKSLLGRTIVMDNIDNAIKFAQKNNYMYRIVTISGEILNPGGSLSGGSHNENISIINRKNKINSMELTLKTMKLKLETLKNDKEKTENQIKLIEKKLGSLEEEIKGANIELVEIRHNERILENDVLFLEKDIIRIEGQIKDIKQNSKEILKKSLDDENSLKEETKVFEKTKNDLKLKLDDLNLYKDNRQRVYKNVTDINLSKSLIENKLSQIEVEIKGIKENQKTNKQLRKEKSKELFDIKDNIEKIIIEKKELDKSIDESHKMEMEIQNNAECKLKDRKISMEMFYSEQEILEGLNENINVLEKLKNDNQLRLSKLMLERDNISLKLLEEYELQIDEAVLLRVNLDNIAEARKQVELLKKKIKNLGNVNVGALEEHKETKERLKFMEAQYKDLIKGKESLRDIIKDMEKEMKVNFLSSFNEINSNFSTIFQELFNGGSATLELNDKEEDILRSGIEIKAKPPGKVLQSLSLLSGGEKSLVAVALLFAMLKTKPSPICILDEIDASLDDANISRYTRYLKKINRDIQFVLITHRKTSMEVANVLYGVTMEEKGISKIISMKLQENKSTLVG